MFRWCDGSYLEDQDFFRYTGVARDCYLYTRNKKRIDDIRVTPDLLHRLDQYEYGFTDEFSLSEDEVKFVTDALRQLISRDNESLRYEKRPKCRSECEKEIRAATVCIARIA